MFICVPIKVTKCPVLVCLLPGSVRFYLRMYFATFLSMSWTKYRLGYIMNKEHLCRTCFYLIGRLPPKSIVQRKDTLVFSRVLKFNTPSTRPLTLPPLVSVKTINCLHLKISLKLLYNVTKKYGMNKFQKTQVSLHIFVHVYFGF